MNTPPTKFAIMRANRDKTEYFALSSARQSGAGKADRWVPPWYIPDVLIDGSEEQTVTHEVIPRTEATA